ncbi:MAG TPA: TetR/AcrR family transcriptional regulator [Chroococcales cyanobacterium]
MARPRADDYHEKQKLILDTSATLFAQKGFAGTSIAAIADYLNTSKALIYHYYQSKESLLFDMLHEHCRLLLETAIASQSQSTDPRGQMKLLLGSFMNIYVSSRAKHVVLLNDLHCLPNEQQQQIRDIEKQVVKIFRDLIEAIRPDLQEKVRTAVAMALLGALNWTYIWFDPDGGLSAEAFAELTASLFFEGIQKIPAAAENLDDTSIKLMLSAKETIS